MSFTYYEDPILGKGRAQVDNGSGGSGGSSYVGGDRINIAGGTISFVNSADIVNVTGASVTLQPDTAYKIYATSQAITLNANPPAAGKWAYEGHLEIFTAGTGYVVTGSNVVLANALEPDAVNNCTVRFHDGIAIISVEDHVAGYIVVSATGTSAGSLYYGLGAASEQYIAVDASLNGQVLDLGGVTTSAGEKHVVGNGYTETIVSGGINCTSKTTFANLGMSNVVVSGGTLTLGDVYIPSGSTVAVSGGGLAIEKVVGDGTGTIDFGGSACVFDTANNGMVSNVSLTNGGSNGIVRLTSVSARPVFISCTFADTNITTNAALYASRGSGGGVNPIVLSGCSFSNSGSYVNLLGGAAAIVSACSFAESPSNTYKFVLNATPITVSECLLGANNGFYLISSKSGVIFAGSNAFGGMFAGTGDGFVTIESGAIVDLTGNTNSAPINPGGGGITFASGGATVLYGDSAGTPTSSAIITGATVPALGNSANVVGTSATRSLFGNGTLTGVTFVQGGGDTWAPANIDYTLVNCAFSGGNMYLATGTTNDSTVTLSGSFVSNVNYTTFIIYQATGKGTLNILDNTTITVPNGADTKLCSNIGTVVVGSGCTINGNDLTPGTYSKCTITKNGTITEG